MTACLSQFIQCRSISSCVWSVGVIFLCVSEVSVISAQLCDSIIGISGCLG